jgi:hypothetical protein
MNWLFSFLDRMRSRSPAARRTFALGVSTGFTVICALIWIVFQLPQSFQTVASSAAATNIAPPGLDLGGQPAPTDPMTDPTADPNDPTAPSGTGDWSTLWAEMQSEYGTGAGGGTGSVQPTGVSSQTAPSAGDSAESLPADDGSSDQNETAAMPDPNYPVVPSY